MVDNAIEQTMNIIKSKADSLTFLENGVMSETFSIMKGLAIKGSIKAYNTVKAIIELMKDTSNVVRESIVVNWHNLFSSNDFSRSNKFNISPFYKQRMFLIAFPALLE